MSKGEITSNFTGEEATEAKLINASVVGNELENIGIH